MSRRFILNETIDHDRIVHTDPASESCNTDQIVEKRKHIGLVPPPGYRKCERCFPEEAQS